MLSLLNEAMKLSNSFFKTKVCYSAIDIGTFQYLCSNFWAQDRASPGKGTNLGSPDKTQ